MIPAGYMAKHVAARPDGLKANQVKNIYSVSNCISDDFADVHVRAQRPGVRRQQLRALPRVRLGAVGPRIETGNPQVGVHRHLRVQRQIKVG